ncbi:MAG: protein-disulfide reductase DsbD family protein [Deltaproteobacteria bacterium]
MSVKKLGWLLVLSILGGVAIVVAPRLLGGAELGSLDASTSLQAGNLWTASGIVFLGGLLTSLTPCVYPLIPITVAVFGGQGATRPTRARSAVLTASYVLGIAALFCALGTAAALTGAAFGKWLSYPWVVVGLAGFFVVMAASMFGAFELALPAGLMQRLSGVGGAGIPGSFAMGLVAGLVAAPCTGPVLAGILVFVGQHQSVVLGNVLLFLYALGIGVPFFIIGVFSFSLGKSGPWMEGVKSLFGIALLALALGYLRDAFPVLHLQALLPAGRVATAAAVAVGVGILLGAVHRSFHGAVTEKLAKATGVALVVLGIAVRFGSASTALAECTPDAAARGECRPGEALPWQRDVAAGLARAKAEQRPAFIDFYADWCGACKELDLKTYPDARVREAARRFVPIKVDGTRSSDALDALYDKYGVEGLPTVVFVDSQGQVLKEPHVVGFVSPAEMVQDLARVK